ncbi:hypothetical protein AVEN_9643-1 [Araneus ventricosus]|uniref:Acyl-CoA synthetase family member 4 n=1 Tax=Araneus ventricosus TaxID=182803 RepID=A0A4Y2EV17_ARAVE|nr:hypothetical protein AVEN_9643-1 [Araneus ventricosus]
MSNAFWISRKTAPVFCLLAKPSLTYSTALKSWCVVDNFSRKPNCSGEKITTRLQLSSEKLFYSYVHGASGSNGLISLDVESGNQVWNSSVSYVPHLKGCGKLVDNSSEACLVTGRSGLFELLNASSGIAVLQLNINSTDNPPMFRYDPVILPDCLGSGISEYGFVVSHNEIKVVYQGYISSSVSVPSCDTEPEKLTPWTTRNNQTDLVFICRKDAKDQLIRMPQNTWCAYKNEGTGKSETSVLETGATGSLDGATLLPTPRGLIVWDQDEVTLFGVSGEKNWTVSSESHFNLNRFLLHGKFSDTGSQIALFSNNAASTLQVSLLDYETGKMTWNTTIKNSEIFDIALMKGEKKDFVLVLQRKVERDLKAEAVSHLSEVPTTLISLLSEEAVVGEADSPKTTLVDEALFMELGSNYYQMVDEKRTRYDEGKSYKSSLTVVHRPNNEIAIVTLKQSEIKFPHTMLRSIGVSNWDISLTENRQCSWSA